eukprot:496978-Hanusia_phi.AAC.1
MSAQGKEQTFMKWNHKLEKLQTMEGGEEKDKSRTFVEMSVCMWFRRSCQVTGTCAKQKTAEKVRKSR